MIESLTEHHLRFQPVICEVFYPFGTVVKIREVAWPEHSHYTARFEGGELIGSFDSFLEAYEVAVRG